MSTQHLGFLFLEEAESEDSYIGAILVTDLSSVPVEFRVTLPVRPNAIQRSLYGDALAPHVGVELCGKPLLETVKHPMQFVIVMPEFMLGVRPDFSAPVVYVEQTSSVIEMVPPGESVNDGIRQERMKIPRGRYQPITLISAPGYSLDLDAIGPFAEELSSKFDLLEPFERIRRALIALKQEDPQFA